MESKYGEALSHCFMYSLKLNNHLAALSFQNLRELLDILNKDNLSDNDITELETKV